MELIVKSLLIVSILVANVQKISARSNSAFDYDLYERVLDSELCERQLTYIRNNSTSLLLQFMDASWRIPRSILNGNFLDLGNYFQCLEISDDVMDIGGKYCTVQFPYDLEDAEFPNVTLSSGITWPESLLKLPWQELDLRNDVFTQELKEKLSSYKKSKYALRFIMGDNPNYHSTYSRTSVIPLLSEMSFELAVCIPRACTYKQALDFYTNNLTSTIPVTENFCRLPNDKKWVTADTVAVVVISIIGLATVISTTYDIRHTIFLERDPKKANQLCQTFSVYTNMKKFFIFPSGPNVVTCLEGIRSFAMIWVVLGHTFLTHFVIAPENMLDMFNFMMAYTTLWISSAPITVDTFFMLTGLLLVYTTASKVSRRDLLKNLHLFYLNRILRMFPVLAASILMTASFLHRLTDGPYLHQVTNWVDNCRANWWSTLLYVQNFVHPRTSCLQHGWYLAIDMHFHIFSPLVLFWVLGQSRRSAWTALVGSLLAILVGTSVYNFINGFISNNGTASVEEQERFMIDYYFHSLPRSPPFFVGMIYGYLLHIYRGKSIKIPKVLVILLWVLTFAGTTFVCSIYYWNVQPDWDNRLLDGFINSYHRPFWSACIGWLVFACHKGYGGPINWVLSLHIFKIIGRLSYAMYIFHYPLQFILHSTILKPFYFSLHHSMYQFIVDFTVSVIASFIVTIFIDLPFSNLIKMALEGKRKKVPPAQTSIAVKEDLGVTKSD